MKQLENYGVQELSAKEITETDGGWVFSGGATIYGAHWSGVTNAVKSAGKWTLGLLAGIADGITDGLND